MLEEAAKSGMPLPEICKQVILQRDLKWKQDSPQFPVGDDFLAEISRYKMMLNSLNMSIFPGRSPTISNSGPTNRLPWLAN